MQTPAAVATLVVSLALAGPASGATADPYASCGGKVGSSLAGSPGARADVQFFGTFAAAAAYSEELGYRVPAGALQSEFSQYHQPLEEC
jgi:hypothetical protein